MSTRTILSFIITLCLLLPAAGFADPWRRHTIDDTSRGADGVRLMDVNGDGYEDIATGWEEGGEIRVYLNPGPKKAKEPWPRVTVGKVKSPEDAVFADIDGDGAVDVVSSCEGRTRTMFVHWAPKDPAKYLDASAWKTESIPVTENAQLWMFCLPMDIDGKHGVDLVVGSKGGGASIGWLESPKNPRDLKAWKFHRLYDAGWIMSLVAIDVDSDGDDDIVASDRKGKNSGVLWLERPEAKRVTERATWKTHRIGAEGEEVMFIHAVKGLEVMVWSALKPRVIEMAVGRPGDRLWQPPWHRQRVSIPEEIAKRTGTLKAVRGADVAGTGFPEFIISCEGATGSKTGLFYLEDVNKNIWATTWQLGDIAGPEGVKFDLIELIDLDGDGDLDVLTCEERDNLGVIWYENPGKGGDKHSN